MAYMAQQQRLPQQQGGQTKETSFNSYTFTYDRRIDDLETKLNRSVSTFSSDFFSSPSGARPSTSWVLTVFTDEDTDTLREDTPPSPPGEQTLSATLQRLPYRPTLQSGRSSARGFSSAAYTGTTTTTPSDDSKAVWVEAELRLQSSNFADLTEFEPTSFSQGPAELSSSANSGTNVMTFKQCLPLFKVLDAQHIDVECEIKVSSEAPPPPIDKPSFSLSGFMEQARQSDLFTDVVLVADGKEYKAHKVILASQSHFFSSRFSGRWVSPKADGSSGDETVDLTDVPAVIMEAMLAYMYTGMVENIGSIAHQLLPAA
ncbi:MAG: BTB/POZ domain-containing protein, partial [Proteobacteria bacterium]|nr:BTB/POZ domain-containing protein [Pseudomonadota bacterium]